MAITIIEQLPNPSFSKNIVAYKVATSLSKECRARIFVETAPYSETYEFVTELKAFPDSSNNCIFYLQNLLPEDILKYDFPNFNDAYAVAPNVCRRIKASFYEYDSADLELVSEVYQDSAASATVAIQSLDNAENYVIVAEAESISAAPLFTLDGGSSKSATLLYQLGNEIWYSLSTSAAYNEVVAEKGIKMNIYKGTAPTLTESEAKPALHGGYTFRNVEAVAAPTNLQIDLVLDDRIDLSWVDNSDNETGFQVETSIDGGVNWVEVTTTAPDVDSYSVPNLIQSTTYHLRVIGVGSGVGEYSNVVNATTLKAVSITTNWNDATASDGAYSISLTDATYTHKWLLPDETIVTNNALSIAADSGILDGTNKVIKLLVDGDQGISAINFINKKIQGALDFEPIGALDITGNFDVSGNDIDDLNFHNDSTFIGSGNFDIYKNNLSGVLDLSPYTIQMGRVSFYQNFTLTNVLFKAGTTISSVFNGSSCDLTGDFDLSNVDFTGIVFWAFSNGNMTDIIWKAGSSCSSQMLVNNCGFAGALNWSNLTVTGELRINACAAATDLTLNAASSMTIFNGSSTGFGDLSPLPMNWDANNITVRLENCLMSEAEVDANLNDADSNSSGGFTGRDYNISGTNAAPSGTGHTYESSLISKNYTVTTTP